MKALFNSEIDLTTGNLFKKMILFTIPMILTTLLQLLYTSCDLFVVAQFGGGSTSMSAVGANGSLINLIVGFFIGLSVGANIVIARAKGANNKEKARRAMYTALIISVIAGIIVGLIGFFMSRYFLEWMKSPSEIIDKATTYLKVYFIGLPFLLIYNFGASILRALGDSKRPLYTLIVTGVVNIALNFLFVVGLKLDVLGVALGTIISEAVSAFLVILFLHQNKKGFICLRFHEFRVYKQELFDILYVGIPSGLQSFIFSISNVLIQAQTNSFGAAAVAGNSASGNIEGYLYNILNSFSLAVSAMAAQNFGANNKANLLKILRNALVTVTVVGIVLGGLFDLLSEPLLSIFIRGDAAAMDVGLHRLLIIMSTYCLCGIMDTMSAFQRGIGYSIFPTIITFIGCTALRIIFIYTFFNFNVAGMHTLEWLYATYPISWGVTDILYAISMPFVIKKAFIKIDKNINLVETKTNQIQNDSI